MNKCLYVDFHILQTVPPSCINRDDTGSPKTAVYGGVLRARVSSQAWKHAMRAAFAENAQLDVGKRTKKAAELVKKQILALAPELDADKLAKKALENAGIKSDDKGTKALFFMSAAQAKALAELAVEGCKDKKQYKDYSTGMKMKLCIAVALAHHPKLLLLDEATNGLDPVVRDEVTDLLLDFARDENHSILISSHIVSDLEKLCDTIAFLHKGRLLLCEEKDALREEYALWHGTAAQLAALDTRVYGKRVTAYGVEALVRRDAMPAGAELTPVSIEELFVLMVKEECAE